MTISTENENNQPPGDKQEIDNTNINTPKMKNDYETKHSENVKSVNNDNLNMEKLVPDSKTVVKFSPLWRQALSSIGPIAMTIAGGLTIGYSATLLPQLKENNSDIVINEESSSWIASISALAMVPACLLGGWVMEKFGRRNSHYIIAVPFFVGWILIATANNLVLIILGRLITGACTGFNGPSGPVLISETTEPKFRGLFLALITLAVALGIFITHCIGTWLPWQWAAVICSTVPILSALSLAFVPESPVWLISKGKTEEGIKAFNWFRGYGEDATLELNNILEKYNKSPAEKVQTSYIDMWKSVEFLKPLLVIFIFFATCHFAGTNVFAFYSVDIIEKAVGKGIDKYLAMIVIDVIRLIMSTIACFASKRFNRRTLCMVSGILTGVSMLLLSLYLNFADDRTDLAWIPLGCLLLYICSLAIGLIPLPWIMCAEIFPTKYRGQGSGISAALGFAAAFIVIKIAPSMFANLGSVMTFFFYGIVALIGTGILFFILPETNKKTLQEIEERFEKTHNQVEIITKC